MLLLIALLFLFLIPVMMLVLERTRLRAGYLWFLALGTALAVWLLVLFARLQMPIQIVLMRWRPEVYFTFSPTLLLDQISWTYAAILAVYPLAILITDIVQVEAVDAQAWAAALGITGLSLLAVLAENPLTLMLAWAMLDFAEVFMLLQRVTDSSQRERVVITFSVRLMGIFLLLTAALVAQLRGEYLTFKQISPDISGILLLAVGLRLGVLPPHQPFFREPPLRRGLGTIVRLASVGSSLTLLARLAVVGVPESWLPYLLIGAILALIYSAFAWVQAQDELDGRPAWILGLATFALITAVLRLPAVSMAWGIALLAGGGILFLGSLRQRGFMLIALWGLLSVSSLPYTPLWGVGSLYGQISWAFWPVFLAAQALFVLGYLRHARRRDATPPEIEPWMRVLHPLGLMLLLVNYWGISWLSGGFQVEFALQSFSWWAGLVIVVMAALLLLLTSRWNFFEHQIFSTIRKLFSLEWMYRLFWWLYRTLSRAFDLLAQIFEGEGGILWAILVLIVLVTMMQQFGGQLSP